MRVKWHDDVTMHGNKTCIVRIYTGETQAIANWRTALGVQGKMDVWEDAEQWIYLLAGAGKDLTENVPEVERGVFDGREVAVVFGVNSNQVTPGGRVFGEYRFVMCMADEVLLVLAGVFGMKKRLGRKAG